MNSTPFQILFGTPAQDIMELCVLIPYPLPILQKALGAYNPAKGKIYTTFSGERVTLICSPMGAAFCGDAVLWLKDTPCQRVIFVGSCGSLKSPEELPLGSIVLPEECYDLESFSSLLSGVQWKDAHTPDQELLNTLSSIKTFPSVTSATLGSLAQEQRIFPQLQDKGIEVVDMECSAVYAAGKASGIKTTSLLFVTDYLKGKTFFETKTVQEKEIIKSSFHQIAELILQLPATSD